ncbi:hypothetical protein BASA83_003807 [Batrachochytrium salamandrivorans]|nr:hypothetical protein BASA83_003807 [Batrachochytrium salamandrivorans]
MRLVIAAAGGSSTTTTANAAANATPLPLHRTDQHTFLAAQESLVAEAATANMARSVEQLLGLTTELKQTLILNDFAALNQQILSRHRTLTNQTALCQTNLAEMRSDLIKVHQQLVDSLYGSV